MPEFFFFVRVKWWWPKNFRRNVLLGELVRCMCRRMCVHTTLCHCTKAAPRCPRRNTRVIMPSLGQCWGATGRCPSLARLKNDHSPGPHPPLRPPASGLVPTAEPQWGVLLLGNNMAVRNLCCEYFYGRMYLLFLSVEFTSGNWTCSSLSFWVLVGSLKVFKTTKTSPVALNQSPFNPNPCNFKWPGRLRTFTDRKSQKLLLFFIIREKKR